MLIIPIIVVQENLNNPFRIISNKKKIKRDKKFEREGLTSRKKEVKLTTLAPEKLYFD